MTYAVIPCLALTGDWVDDEPSFTFCSSEEDALETIQAHFDSGDWIGAQYMPYDEKTGEYDRNVCYCYRDYFAD